MEKRPATIFIDIDGTILKHHKTLWEIGINEPELLEGVRETFNSWEMKGYKIILTTGRKESLREKTEKDLKSLGIFYDQLIMGLGGGIRYIINDFKNNSNLPTCHAITVERNKGIKHLIDL
jgi:hydroxymethylpyrimidine pyrophosphatase-like HAD family hydrolase